MNANGSRLGEIVKADTRDVYAKFAGAYAQEGFVLSTGRNRTTASCMKRIVESRRAFRGRVR